MAGPQPRAAERQQCAKPASMLLIGSSKPHAVRSILTGKHGPHRQQQTTSLWRLPCPRHACHASQHLPPALAAPPPPVTPLTASAAACRGSSRSSWSAMGGGCPSGVGGMQAHSMVAELHGMTVPCHWAKLPVLQHIWGGEERARLNAAGKGIGSYHEGTPCRACIGGCFVASTAASPYGEGPPRPHTPPT